MGATLPGDDEVDESREDGGRAMVVEPGLPSAGRVPVRASVPSRIAHFTVLGRLGAGGMGEVFLGYDEQLARHVAIKLVRSEHGRKRWANQRLLREARTLARISHPNVVQVYHVGVHQDRVFVAMELIEGCTLRTWLAQYKRSQREILDAYFAAGRGLAAAHDQGLIHRDFKPENVLISARGWVSVVDFGLAGAPYRDEGGAMEPVPGAIMGTPGYMSPEQSAGECTDARTDQFSFCVALYEALHGEMPFDKPPGTYRGSIRRRTSLRPVPQRSGVPRRLHRVLARGLSAHPDDRYPSMNALLAELERVTVRRQRPLLRSLLACALVAASFAGSPSDEAPPCTAAGETVQTIWNTDVETQLRHVFASTGAPYASDAFVRVRDGLDAYTGELRAMSQTLCEATVVSHEQSRDLFVVRSLCINERERHLATLIESLNKADREAVARSVQALAELPDIDSCGTTRSLLEAPASGVDEHPDERTTSDPG